MTDAKPYRHHFAMTIIQYAVWLSHRSPISDQDVQELLHQRGIQVSHQTLRERCIKSAPSSQKNCVIGIPGGISTKCIRAWTAFATDFRGPWMSTGSFSTLSYTEAAKTFLTRLLRESDVPEVIHTDQLWSYGATIREIPSLVNVNHQVVSTAGCNNIIEQEHRSTRRQEHAQQGFRRRKRA